MNRIILVTGASSGLGYAAAAAFTAAGDRVYGTSRTGRAGPEGCVMLPLDVDDPASCTACMKRVEEETGRLDVLVNNAGFGIAGPVELTEEAAMKRQFETLFFGAVRMAQLALPLMRAQGGGRIIQISSAAAALPVPFQGFYSAAKAALEVLTYAMGAEVKAFGVRLSCIEFGDMKTGFTADRETSDAAPPYGERFQKSVARMAHDEQNGPLPVGAAKLILKVSRKKDPKPLYVCGFTYKAFAIFRRLLPYRLSGWVIGKLYG